MYDEYYRTGPGAENKRVFDLNVQLNFLINIFRGIDKVYRKSIAVNYKLITFNK
jgi:hypothetical protein